MSELPDFDSSPLDLLGHEVEDNTGCVIGEIHGIRLDPDTGKPAWMQVATADRRGRYVPFAGAAPASGKVRIAFTHARVVRAPAVTADVFSYAEQSKLQDYYGFGELAPPPERPSEGPPIEFP